MALLETRASGNKADLIVKRLGFNNWLRVEATGYAGGIWLLWNEWETDVQYVYSDTQILHCKITGRVVEEFMEVSFVYGEPSAHFRTDLWSSLRTLASNLEGKWLVMGDFNTYLRDSDKVGG